MGAEFRRKGVNLLLGPVVGPLGRVAEGGRNWEGFSDDPYLSGSLVFDTIQGIQSAGVGASTKVSNNLGTAVWCGRLEVF
jgi:beta-glucosidase